MEAKQETNQETMKLPILPIKPNTHSNSLSSPIHSSISASIPFSWEDEPGKPKSKPKPKPSSSSLSSSTSSSTLTSSDSSETLKSLELPPRLLQLQSPSMSTRSRRLDSPSFRMMMKVSNSECYGSFRSDIYVEEEPEESKNSLVVVKKRGRLGFFGFRRRKALKKGKSEFGRGSYVFPSESREEEEEGEGVEEKSFGYGDGDGENGISCSQSSRFCEVKINNITRTGSFSTHPSSTPSSSKSHFWTNVYAGLKQVVPWKNKKTTS